MMAGLLHQAGTATTVSFKRTQTNIMKLKVFDVFCPCLAGFYNAVTFEIPTDVEISARHPDSVRVQPWRNSSTKTHGINVIKVTSG